jgi:broad specificity phosphatase PhoE
MSKCPNTSSPQWQLLVDKIGPREAYKQFRILGEVPEANKYSKVITKIDNLRAWDTGTISGKDQKTYEPQMEKLIVADPNAKIGGGESFNDVKKRTILQGKRLLNTVPGNSAVVTHSTVLKFLLLWDKMGRPADLSGITAEKYLDESTSTGEMEKMKGTNGDVYFIRHGETEDNKDGKLRTDNTMLTNKGIVQANKLGEQLKDVQISHVYTSPLPRAIHTSDLVLSKQTSIQNTIPLTTGTITGPSYVTPAYTPTTGLTSGQYVTFTSEKEINASLKSVDVSRTPKAIQEWNKLQKGNISFDQFLNNSQFPKEQKELLKDIYDNENPKTIADLITGLMSKYSYTVEINTTKKNIEHPVSKEYDKEWFDTRDELINQGYSTTEANEQAKDILKHKYNYDIQLPTQYYSNLTVPGGTNYTENEIATPGIVPSIKGHAQFSTDNGIGWFRGDDKRNDTLKGEWIKDTSKIPNEFTYSGQKVWKDNSGEWNEGNHYIEDIQTVLWKYNMSLGNRIDTDFVNTKTRRILEVQSDLFQKGRDKTNLVNAGLDDEIKRLRNAPPEESGDNRDRIRELIELRDNQGSKSDNQFLQLLNKDGNWIPFFIKSIVQDSAKKGYEKVLFPTGETAAKIEGHETLAKQIQAYDTHIETIKKIEKAGGEELPDYLDMINHGQGDQGEYNINPNDSASEAIKKLEEQKSIPVFNRANFYEVTSLVVSRKEQNNLFGFAGDVYKYNIGKIRHLHSS